MNLLGKIIASVIGLGLSDYFIQGVDGRIETIFIAGIVLGVLLFFVKPILNLITFPLKIITFNLFSLVIIGFLIWLTTQIMGNGLVINGYLPLVLTTLIIWISELLFASDI